MAMNKEILGKAIATKILAPNAPPDMVTQVQDLWISIADEIIKHLITNAEITVAAGITVATAGTAAAQTGATTSTGTAKITG